MWRWDTEKNWFKSLFPNRQNNWWCRPLRRYESTNVNADFPYVPASWSFKKTSSLYPDSTEINEKTPASFILIYSFLIMILLRLLRHKELLLLLRQKSSWQNQKYLFISVFNCEKIPLSFKYLESSSLISSAVLSWYQIFVAFWMNMNALPFWSK